MMTMIIVYKATNILNGKSYIGFTKDFDFRIKCHIKNAHSGKKGSFYNALRKYSTDSFKWSILRKSLTRKFAAKYEKYFIKKNNTKINGYNQTDGGEGVIGYVFTNSDKLVISTAQKKRFLSNEQRIKCSSSEGKSFSVFNKKREFIGSWRLQSKCAKEINVIQAHISSCLSGKRKSCRDYIFIYEDKLDKFDEIFSWATIHCYPTQLKFSVHDRDNKLLGIWTNYSKCNIDLGITGSSRYVKGLIKSNKYGYKFKVIK